MISVLSIVPLSTVFLCSFSNISWSSSKKNVSVKTKNLFFPSFSSRAFHPTLSARLPSSLPAHKDVKRSAVDGPPHLETVPQLPSFARIHTPVSSLLLLSPITASGCSLRNKTEFLCLTFSIFLQCKMPRLQELRVSHFVRPSLNQNMTMSHASLICKKKRLTSQILSTSTRRLGITIEMLQKKRPNLVGLCCQLLVHWTSKLQTTELKCLLSKHLTIRSCKKLFELLREISQEPRPPLRNSSYPYARYLSNSRPAHRLMEYKKSKQALHWRCHLDSKVAQTKRALQVTRHSNPASRLHCYLNFSRSLFPRRVLHYIHLFSHYVSRDNHRRRAPHGALDSHFPSQKLQDKMSSPPSHTMASLLESFHSSSPTSQARESASLSRPPSKPCTSNNFSSATAPSFQQISTAKDSKFCPHNRVYSDSTPVLRTTSATGEVSFSVLTPATLSPTVLCSSLSGPIFLFQDELPDNSKEEMVIVRHGVGPTVYQVFIGFDPAFSVTKVSFTVAASATLDVWTASARKTLFK